MNTVYLSLGGNQGDRRHLLDEAVKLIESKAGNIIKQSAYYETKAWGLEDQPDFLNICLCLETDYTPRQLLISLQAIEQDLHRQRTQKWGPRTIDIDILFYNDDIVQDEYLSIPHPYVSQRMFVLLPLAEIAPGLKHPVLHKTVAELQRVCPDDLEVRAV